MKKLTIAAALLSLSIAAPAFACPDHGEKPRTAEKATQSKETAKASDTAAKKDTKAAPKAEKPADPKTGEKVSQK